jgi:hypothetical protein
MEDWVRPEDAPSIKAVYDRIPGPKVSYESFLRKLHRFAEGNLRTTNRIRRQLGLPVERKRRPAVLVSPTRLVTVPCVECGAAVELTDYRRLYCSERCRQVLKLIHYGRRVFRDGRLATDPLVDEAIGMRIAQIMASGYRQAARRVPRAVRQAIFERDGWRCQLCGRPAAEIDHITGDSSDPSNLRALCAACNRAEAKKRTVHASAKQQVAIDGFIARMAADPPLFERDNERAWGSLYRAIQSQRRQEMREAGTSVRG